MKPEVFHPRNVRSELKAVVGRLLGRSHSRDRDSLPLHGYRPSQTPVSGVDGLSDEQLKELNTILHWNCFTVDGRGRRFGDRAKRGKRERPQPIPDDRITLLNSLQPLSGKRVLEVGCFEGVHTTALCQFGAKVTAVDSRIENVVKTMVRCGFYGANPSIFVSDVDLYPLDSKLPEVDVLFHCGVLYHLVDPVRHLTEIAPRVKQGIFLDTHYARNDEATESYASGGKTYTYRHYGEHGTKSVFAGMYDHAKWLKLGDLKKLIKELGFQDLQEERPRDERNGARVLIIARRP